MARPLPTDRHRSPTRLRLAVPLLVATALALGGACGGDSSPTLTGEAATGAQVARNKGCTSCHTANGNKSEGPTWKGLAGSTVTLADGTKVTADDAYLARSMKEPKAQLVQGFKTAMPAVPLTDAEVSSLIAYIKALA